MKYKIVSMCISFFAMIGAFGAQMYCQGWYYKPQIPKEMENIYK
ncbi:cyclic lactone autoinducer peptide [Lutibacter sp. B2]|nr:cyclic lactone autoinducer peptide [Lutibacter sp. B2]